MADYSELPHQKVLDRAFLDERTKELLGESIDYTLSSGNECAFAVGYNPFNEPVFEHTELSLGHKGTCEMPALVWGTLILGFHTHLFNQDEDIDTRATRYAGFDLSIEDLKIAYREFLDYSSWKAFQEEQGEPAGYVHNPVHVKINPSPRESQLQLFQFTREIPGGIDSLVRSGMHRHQILGRLIAEGTLRMGDPIFYDHIEKYYLDLREALEELLK
jgi:hypothetical protein